MGGDAGRPAPRRQAPENFLVTIPRLARQSAQSGTGRFITRNQPNPESSLQISMKSIVKILLSIFALGLLASAPVLRAQDEPAPPAQGKGDKGKGGGMLTVARIEQAVGTLTDDQKTKSGNIIAKAQTDMQALTQEERASKGREIQQTMRTDIRALLTADQQTKFDAMGQGGKGKKKEG